MKNYKGSICRIDQEEVLQLISDLEHYKLVRHHEDVKRIVANGSIKWTTTKSNPIYQTLKFIIDEHNEGNPKVNSEIDEGALYSLLHARNKKKHGIYEYNLNALYHFLYGKSRRRYQLQKVYDSSVNLQKSIPVYLYGARKKQSALQNLAQILAEESGITVHQFNWDNPGASLERTMFKVDRGVLIQLITDDYLQDPNAIKDLTEYLNNTPEKIKYLDRTIHVLMPSALGDNSSFNISTDLGRIGILGFWLDKIAKVKDQITIIQNMGDTIPEIKLGLEDIKKSYENIALNIRENLSTLYDKNTSLRYTTLQQHPSELLAKVREKINPQRKDISIIIREVQQSITVIDELYNSIIIPSENDPAQPEFPPEPFYTPNYPASDCYRINIPNFTNVWLKDESTNPTGTHKDRMAWEVVIKYKEFLKQEQLKRLVKNEDQIPRLSIISSGSAAIAIQNFLRKYDLPDLKVLVDETLDPNICHYLTQAGCELYKYDLSFKLLTPEEIKLLTNNTNGLDITYREIIDHNYKSYYDWLSYEILNQQPDFCFVPFGTGDLFQNILAVVHDEQIAYPQHDPRLQHPNLQQLLRCNFMGATTDNPNSKLQKLYSAFLPSLPIHQKRLQQYKSKQLCGSYTDIYRVNAPYVNKAIQLAQDIGVNCEPSGIAGLALLLQIDGQKRIPIKRDAKIVIVNTGNTKYGVG